MAAGRPGFAPVAATLHPNCLLYEPASLPYSGEWQGLDGVERWLRMYKVALVVEVEMARLIPRNDRHLFRSMLLGDSLPVMSPGPTQVSAKRYHVACQPTRFFPVADVLPVIDSSGQLAGLVVFAVAEKPGRHAIDPLTQSVFLRLMANLSVYISSFARPSTCVG